MVKFGLVAGNCDNSVNWIGKYTYGSITNGRGTTIYFQPCAAKYLHQFQEIEKYSFLDICKYPNVKIDKSDGNCYDFSTTWMYLPGTSLTNCYIRRDTLIDCVNKIEFQPINELVEILNDEFTDEATKEKQYEEYGFDVFGENYIKRLYNDYYKIHKEEIISSEGYCYFYEEYKILYYLKYDKIITELEKVADYAVENDVEQCWY
jgi:hypothetical protein